MLLNKPSVGCLYDVMADRHHVGIAWKSNSGEHYRFKCKLTTEQIHQYSVNHITDYICGRLASWLRNTHGVSRWDTREVARLSRPQVLAKIQSAKYKKVYPKSELKPVFLFEDDAFVDSVEVGIFKPQNMHIVKADLSAKGVRIDNARKLPGIMKSATFPCDCPLSGAEGVIYVIIMHLNDYCGWTREQIADWLDDLHDSGKVNIEFDPWNEEQTVVAEAEAILAEHTESENK